MPIRRKRKGTVSQLAALPPQFSDDEADAIENEEEGPWPMLAPQNSADNNVVRSSSSEREELLYATRTRPRSFIAMCDERLACLDSAAAQATELKEGDIAFQPSDHEEPVFEPALHAGADSCDPPPSRPNKGDILKALGAMNLSTRTGEQGDARCKAIFDVLLPPLIDVMLDPKHNAATPRMQCRQAPWLR